MKAVIAGNYSLDPSAVAMHLLRQLAELPIDVTILMRLPVTGRPGPVESLAEQIAKDLSIPVEWRMPKPGGGGEATIDRDFAMVEDADLVIAYFHPDSVMSDERGTTRLVRHAMAIDKPASAYIVHKDEVGWVGSVETTTHA